ncbi:MAG: BamA/TamA family outer membrane protein [Elusimicrobia bacterium]|nr:BamA/TamA family outer membrane protein [Elusimicrobiota bacterium]
MTSKPTARNLRVLVLVSLFVLQASRLSYSQTISTATVSTRAPLILKTFDYLLTPFSQGAIARLPVIDTDPNRGPTMGFMPVWVVQNKKEDRIIHIHAPSITYNRIFRWNTTYRYYYYPTRDSELDFRASSAFRTNREIMADYKGPVAATELDVHVRLNYDRDGSKRFFGIGPNSRKEDESNYTLETLMYLVDFGFPIISNEPWKIRLGNQFMASKVLDGPISDLPDIATKFPQFATPQRQKTMLYHLGLGYDTRDHKTTTKEGAYSEIYAEASRRFSGSDTNFHRYGLDFRWFKPHSQRWTHALRAQMQQAFGGNIPFYLEPSLGGKYLFRSYGEGRYIDRGMTALSLEERCKVWHDLIAGVLVEISIDPFYQIGAVYPKIDSFKPKYIRQAVGVALRMIARPQVVGSLDLGVGDEGLSVFVDINYSY